MVATTVLSVTAQDLYLQEQTIAANENVAEVTAFVERMYTVALGRDGEEGGVEYWTIAIARGETTMEAAAKSFFKSDEYVNKNSSDADYVKALYRTFMDRTADEGGLEFWVNSMVGGMDRDAVLGEFAKAPEFGEIIENYFPSEEPENPEQPGEEKEPISFIMRLPSEELHEDENPLYDKLVADLNEYLNADITWEWAEPVSYYEDELMMELASGELSDVRVVAKDYVFCDAVEYDLFWDLTDYIDEYDNLATIPQAVRENASINGRMYGIPRSRTLARNGMGYRVDWLKALGIS